MMATRFIPSMVTDYATQHNSEQLQNITDEGARQAAEAVRQLEGKKAMEWVFRHWKLLAGALVVWVLFGRGSR